MGMEATMTKYLGKSRKPKTRQRRSITTFVLSVILFSSLLYAVRSPIIFLRTISLSASSSISRTFSASLSVATDITV